jgi:hypothetical protein
MADNHPKEPTTDLELKYTRKLVKESLRTVKDTKALITELKIDLERQEGLLASQLAKLDSILEELNLKKD